LIYVSDSDFYESISSVRPSEDITQLNVNKNKIIYGKMKASGFKKILYNWKLLYYFYNRFPLNLTKNQNKHSKKEIKKHENDFVYQNEIQSLLIYVKEHYEIKNKILIFHPNSELKLAKRLVLKCI